MFFDRADPNDTLENRAVDPSIGEYDRMVYLALSEYFFDSGMYAYYKAGVFQMHIVNDKVRPPRPLGPPEPQNPRTPEPYNPGAPRGNERVRSDLLFVAFRCPENWRCC